jgi:hypothetical protein
VPECPGRPSARVEKLPPEVWLSLPSAIIRRRQRCGSAAGIVVSAVVMQRQLGRAIASATSIYRAGIVLGYDADRVLSCRRSSHVATARADEHSGQRYGRSLARQARHRAEAPRLPAAAIATLVASCRQYAIGTTSETLQRPFSAGTYSRMRPRFRATGYTGDTVTPTPAMGMTLAAEQRDHCHGALVMLDAWKHTHDP